MPKRTNDFQRIVFLIQKILGDRAVVQESALLKDRETGNDVEVDILIRGDVAGTTVVIGVECVDRSRPSDIEWVRSMLKKHEDLPIDKPIFVSKAGFTRQAIAKAKANGAETLTFEEVENHDWISELKENANLKIAAYQLSILSGSVNFKQKIPTDILQSVSQDTLIFNKSNLSGIKLSEYGSAVIRRNDVFEESIQHWFKFPKEQRGKSFKFDLNITPDVDTSVEINGERYFVDSFSFKVKAEVTSETPVKVELTSFRGQVVGYSKFQNIFPGSKDKNRNAIFTLIEKDGKLDGLLSIPDYEGNGDKEFQIKLPKQKLT